MFFNKGKILILVLIFQFTDSLASKKENIIQKLNDIDNLTFNFEQNINGKIENGNCTLQYPKKIFCKYSLRNNKILISNGKSLVIKTKTSYYRYPLENTPLNLILDKNFLSRKITELNERIIDDKFINYNFFKDENEINIFFNKKNYDLVGWQTLDIYQNLSITYISILKKNQKLKKNFFDLPKQN